MLRRRSGPFSPQNDLPPVRSGAWAAVGLVDAAGLYCWIRFEPAFLVGGIDGGPWQALQYVLAFAVPVGLVVLFFYAIWRFQLDRLARRPGPVLVTPFADMTTRVDPGLHTDESPLGAELTALFQQYLVRSRVYGSTAIPSSGWASDFLTVIERAGDSTTGVWGVVGRLPRILFPVSAYRVSCTVIPPQPDNRDASRENEPIALLVELTRFPNSLVAPVVIRGDDWERVVEKAAHWVAGVILPRTRQCRFPPWTMWRRLRMPEHLFDHYQRYQQHLSDRELDAAMAELRAARILDPGNLALRLEMGKLQEQLGMQLDALATYEELIGRASRGDRGLALLWNLPPSEWGEGPEPTAADDPAWSDAGRVNELPARHPVVYVARYRHMLLLGLGERLADQWWLAPFRDRQERCRKQEHWPVHERRSDFSRRLLNRRLSARYPWMVTILRERALLTEPAELFLSTIETHTSASGGSAHRQLLRSQLEIFLTAASVCELELLLLERGADLVTSPAVRDVVSVRSLELVLPLSVLRAALAIENAKGRGNVDVHTPTRLAGRSIVHRRTRPDVLGRRGAGLLDAGWPPDLGVLRRYVAHILQARIRTLHSWHEHYNAACTFALALLEPAKGTQHTADTTDDVGPPGPITPADARRVEAREKRRAEVAEAAVGQLYKAVACGDSGFLAAQRDWLLTQDPDLDVLRGTDEFFDLEAATYGSVRATGRRGPNMVSWQIRTFATGIVLDVARKMRGVWDDRPRVDDARPGDVRDWLALEGATWAVVENLCREHRDSAARHSAVAEIRTRCSRFFPIPNEIHPRFGESLLRDQCASQRVAVPEGPADPPGRIRRQVQTVIDNSTSRFANTAEILRPQSPGSCCPLDDELVTVEETADIGDLLEPTRGRLDDRDLEKLRAWTGRSRDRWEAMTAYFDDGCTHTSSLEDRRERLERLFDHERF